MSNLKDITRKNSIIKKLISMGISTEEDLAKSKEVARVNLFMPKQLKEDVMFLAGIKGSNLSYIIIEQLQEYVEENRELIDAVKELRK